GREIGIHDNFFDLGIDSIKGANYLTKIQRDLNEYVFIVALFDAPTIAELAEYLCRRCPEAVSRTFGVGSLVGTSPAATGKNSDPASSKIDEEAIREFQKILVAPPKSRSTRKNAQAIFVLAPPRSGSTLLRVMLGRHPKLFAPPELALLGFSTLKD